MFNQWLASPFATGWGQLDHCSSTVRPLSGQEVPLRCPVRFPLRAPVPGWAPAFRVALPLKTIVLFFRPLRFPLKIKWRGVWKSLYCSYLCIPQTRYCGPFIEFRGCFFLGCRGQVFRDCFFFGFCFAVTVKALIFAPRCCGDKWGPGAAEKNKIFYFAESKKPLTFAIPKRTGPYGATPWGVKKKRSATGYCPGERYTKPAREATGAKFLKEKIIM